ncbi:hypothetical protein KEM55_006710, partial [Ascosphaera atra]
NGTPPVRHENDDGEAKSISDAIKIFSPQGRGLDPESTSEAFKGLYWHTRQLPEVLPFEKVQDTADSSPIKISCKNSIKETQSNPPEFTRAEPVIETLIRNGTHSKPPEQPYFMEWMDRMEFTQWYWADAFVEAFESVKTLLPAKASAFKCVRPEYVQQGPTGFLLAR